jgi:hypothetical protein
LASKDLAGRWRDLTLGKDAGRDLIEQRLEEVVGGLGDQRDVNVGVFERLRGEQPTEPGADHHHLVSATRDGALYGALTHGSSVLIDVLTDALVDVLVDAPEPMPGRPRQQR